MFYCEKCQVKNNWPEGFATSYGKCEICGASALCNNVSPSRLPKTQPQLMEYLVLSVCKLKDEENNTNVYQKQEVVRAESVETALQDLRYDINQIDGELVDYHIEPLIEGGFFDALIEDILGVKYDINDTHLFDIKKALRISYYNGLAEEKRDITHPWFTKRKKEE